MATDDDSNDLATTSEPDVIDAAWSPVEADDDYSDYQLEPSFSDVDFDSDSGGGWRGGWMQQPADSNPVAYAEPEPDVIDTPFTFLEPEPDKYPVKRQGIWHGGWFGGNDSDDDTTDTEIERYTAARLQSDEVLEASWQPTGERKVLENPYLRSTDDFFRNVETGENEPAPSNNPFVGFWAQTTAATSQAADAWHDATTDTKTTSKTKSKQTTRSGSKSKQNNRNSPRDATSPQTHTSNPLSAPTTTKTTYQDSKGVKPSDRGKGGADKDYPWYYLAYPDPREPEDIQYLRYWYLLYEYSDGIPEWDDVKFQQWAASLKGADRDLYVKAGQQIADNELYEQLQGGTLKTAFESMRLEGDDGQSALKDPVGHFSAMILRGFSRW